MMKRLLPVQISTLADDEVEVVMSTGALARDGHILVPQGVKLDNYRTNPVVLWQHNPDYPVGCASEIRVSGDSIVARITFAPLGVSAKADEVRGLVKSGIVNAGSVGFEVTDSEPLDPKRPRGGKRIIGSELLEFSFVSVPADTGAAVTARENERDEMTEQTRAAEAAADHAPANDTAAADTVAREPALLQRGLYEVSELAYVLAQLGYCQSWAQFEAECEGDGSEIPAMLGAVMKDLGNALIAMTQEEVAELCGSPDGMGERCRVAITRAKRDGFARAGKTYSSATKAKIQEALDHHESGSRCLRDMLERDDDGGGEMSHEPAITRAAEPAANDNGRAAALERLRQLRNKR